MFLQQILLWPSREHGWFHGSNLDPTGASSPHQSHAERRVNPKSLQTGRLPHLETNLRAATSEGISAVRAKTIEPHGHGPLWADVALSRAVVIHILPAARSGKQCALALIMIMHARLFCGFLDSL